jgi:hypothetical protein
MREGDRETGRRAESERGPNAGLSSKATGYSVIPHKIALLAAMETGIEEFPTVDYSLLRGLRRAYGLSCSNVIRCR